MQVILNCCYKQVKVFVLLLIIGVIIYKILRDRTILLPGSASGSHNLSQENRSAGGNDLHY